MEDQVVSEQIIKKRFPFLIIIPLIILIIVILFCLGLLIYSVLLSKGLLPNSPVSKPEAKTELVAAEPLIPQKTYPKNLQAGPFNCPTIKSICTSGVYKENTLSGNIPNKTPVFAAFDGWAEGLISSHPNGDNTNEAYDLVILINQEKGLTAYYSLKGQTTTKKEVKAGEQIATSSGQPIKFLDNKSFIFEMVKFGETGASKSALLRGDFK